jgi:hypothetical protein
MMIHPSMSMAIAEAKRDDLIREIRPPAGGPRAVYLRADDALTAPYAEGVSQRLRQVLRRAHRTRAAEPAS